jgi:hypothetical protein
MNKQRRRWIERIKTAGIVLLLILAVFLSNEIGLLSNMLAVTPLAGIVNRFQLMVTEHSESDSMKSAELNQVQILQPVAVMATGENGGRYGAFLDSDAVAAAYEKFSAALAEALGSAGTSTPVGMDVVIQDLKTNSVFIDFGWEHELSHIASWLGTRMTSSGANMEVRRICLSDYGDHVSLYYQANEQWYTCTTGLAGGTIQTRVQEFDANGAQFVWELGEDLSNIDPFFIVLEELPDIESISASNPVRNGNVAEEILELFEINHFVANTYPETDGTVVYVEGSKTLRISPEGTIVFRTASPEGLSLKSGTQGGVPEQISEIYSRLNSLIAPLIGDADFLYTGFQQGETEDTYVFNFDYHLNGLPIVLSGQRHAVQVQISDSSITYMSISLREYNIAMGKEKPMPIGLMLANCQAGGGGEPMLIYEDDGTSVEAYWTVRKTEDQE